MQTQIRAGKKVCCACRERKPASEFWRDPRQKDGRDATCSTCRKPSQRKYRQSLAVKNRRARWEATATQRAKQSLRRQTTKLFGKAKRCAVPECKRRDCHWHHLNGDPREVISCCARHHKAIHCV